MIKYKKKITPSSGAFLSLKCHLQYIYINAEGRGKKTYLSVEHFIYKVFRQYKIA